MKLAKIAEELGLQDLTPEVREAKSREVSGGYVSDLLSDVLANAPEGGILVTVQVHLNVVAVALHTGLSAVIFSSGRMPENAVIERARKEGIQLYTSKEASFDIVGRLYQMGVRGGKK
ncbi:MAG: serine kinase [Planctomycetota bacterium]|nr:serine kinase [Planctomycetota bacterium]